MFMNIDNKTHTNLIFMKNDKKTDASHMENQEKKLSIHGLNSASKITQKRKGTEEL